MKLRIIVVLGKWLRLQIGKPFGQETATADGLLQDADDLLMLGYVRYAAIAARSALEETLGTVCYKEGLQPKRKEDGQPIKRPRLCEYLDTLDEARLIDRKLRVRVSRLLGAINPCAHGGDAAPIHVLRMIEATHLIRGLLARAA